MAHRAGCLGNVPKRSWALRNDLYHSQTCPSAPMRFQAIPNAPRRSHSRCSQAFPGAPNHSQTFAAARKHSKALVGAPRRTESLSIVQFYHCLPMSYSHMFLGAPRRSHVLSCVPTRSQAFPKASKRSKTPPDLTRHFSALSGALGASSLSQALPGAFKCFRAFPGIPWRSEMFPVVPRRSQLNERDLISSISCSLLSLVRLASEHANGVPK